MATTVTRGTFGEITSTETVNEGREIIRRAIALKALPAEYIETDRKGRGDCRNYDVYDRLGGQWLIQRRDTRIDKYGAHPIKSYYLIRRKGRGIEVSEVEKKAVANRAAKTAVRLGDAIRTLRGERKLPGHSVRQEVTICYKAVALVNGAMQSIYDETVSYEIGKTLIQKAQENHSGGFYAYATESEARNAEVPSNSDNLRAPRAILKVEVSGRCIEYDNGKMSWSRMKPVEVIG
jgi:hypothetical protein